MLQHEKSGAHWRDSCSSDCGAESFLVTALTDELRDRLARLVGESRPAWPRA